MNNESYEGKIDTLADYVVYELENMPEFPLPQKEIVLLWEMLEDRVWSYLNALE
jgi:hypothetical protein